MSKSVKEVRVIGGKHKGRKLNVDDPNVKPTPDRVRETLFNWLEPKIFSSRVLDLFAGTGVLSVEALSRGAASVTLADSSEAVHLSLEELMENLKVSEYKNLYLDSYQLISKPNPDTPYSIIFLDPPYGEYNLSTLLQKLYQNLWANERTWVYFESNRPIKIGDGSKHFIFKESRAGKVYYALIKSK